MALNGIMLNLSEHCGNAHWKCIWNAIGDDVAVRLLLGANADIKQITIGRVHHSVRELLRMTMQLVALGCNQADACAALTECNDQFEDAADYLVRLYLSVVLR